uniref:Cytochrome c oxidase subunit 3 n=1 Tax=Lyonsia norwegica TaxID=228471 RepID=A0A1U9XPH2_LYONO|nr:cytochrome c oxidase subunit III [Lyonsia norwegica]AQZ26148.1 cytochrome c oxidase subunit III [Lyonsia norwegica]
MKHMNNYIKHSRGHGFHIVDNSPWPVLAAGFVLSTAVGLVEWLTMSKVMVLAVGLAGLLTVSGLWWNDITRESVYQGRHTSLVKRGLKAGFVLFLLSEGCFFFSLFWAFFHSALAPTPQLGSWPPAGIATISPWKVPLLNTAVLLSSGFTLTYGHHGLMEGYTCKAQVGFFVSVVLGGYFTWLQYNEYLMASFSMADSVYGSTFYLLTGFHGLHVIIGTSFLIVQGLRIRYFHAPPGNSVGIKSSIWYWHFVDGVWIVVFLTLYVWGSW